MSLENLMFMSDDEYSKADGVRKSLLDRINISPAMVNVPWSGSKATDFGSLIHCLVLQPQTLKQNFAIEPAFNKRTNAGKEEAEAFAKENTSKIIIITKEDFEKAVGMREEVMACIGDWLEREDTIIEHAAFWTDPATGLKCKCKPDIYVASENRVIDLKKTAEVATAYDFGKSVSAFRYHVQQAFYTEGLKANGIDVDHFNFAAVSIRANGGVGVFALDENTVSNGIRQMRADLTLYSVCQNNGHFPRLPSQVQTISLKAWQLKQSIFDDEA